MDDPYSSPVGCLLNELGIEDPAELAEIEAEVTIARMAILIQSPLPGGYDLLHLRAFHRFLFRRIYSWAGEIRTIDIAKGNAFCRSMHIEAYAGEIFGKLAGADFLRGLDRADFIDGLAETLADINALHPFREGNGRTQRAFVQQLAAEAGHPVSWAGLNPADNIEASIQSFNGYLAPLVALLNRHVSRRH